MRKIDVRLDVTETTATGEHLEMVASVFLPEPGVDPSGTVLVGLPGGGYNRHYFDLRPRGLAGYSQAEHHTRHGHVVIAVDPLAVGASDVPEKPIDFSAVSRAGVATARGVVSRLRTGTLAAEVPALDVAATVGMGHSYGGFLLIVGQALDPFFDGIAVLGYSGIEIVPPWPPEIDLDDVLTQRAGNGLDHPMQPYYFCSDVPLEIVSDELTMQPGTVCASTPWATRYMPGGPANVMDRHPRGRGAVTAEAAAVEVPVLVGCGDIDVVGDPWAEPAAYRGSRLVTMAVIPQMAHMHNFAGSRTWLWDRLEDFAVLVDSIRQGEG